MITYVDVCFYFYIILNCTWTSKYYIHMLAVAPCHKIIVAWCVKDGYWHRNTWFGPFSKVIESRFFVKRHLAFMIKREMQGADHLLSVTLLKGPNHVIHLLSTESMLLHNFVKILATTSVHGCVPICEGVLILTQLNSDQLSLIQIDLIELLYFWVESVASERRIIVQILLKFC